MSDSGQAPDEPDYPPHVRAVFDALKAGAQVEGRLCTVRLRTVENGRDHYVISVMNSDGDVMPLAFIPADCSMTEFLNRYDGLMLKHGPESDPDFREKCKGIIQ